MFVLNNLAYVNELYSYEVQMCNYKDGITVQQCLLQAGFKTTERQQWDKYDEQIKLIAKESKFEELMKSYCDVKDSDMYASGIIAESITKIRPEISDYYQWLGKDKIKAKSYKEIRLKEEVKLLRKWQLC